MPAPKPSPNKPRFKAITVNLPLPLFEKLERRRFKNRNSRTAETIVLLEGALK